VYSVEIPLSTVEHAYNEHSNYILYYLEFKTPSNFRRTSIFKMDLQGNNFCKHILLSVKFTALFGEAACSSRRKMFSRLSNSEK
jgi:hypothetical protein